MRKFIAVAVLVLLSAIGAGAQTTTVTAVVADANSNAYFPGTVSAFIVLNTGQPLPAGASLSTGPIASTSGGNFSIVVFSPASYQFTFCGVPPSIGPRGNVTPNQVCFSTQPIAIAGGSQTITSNLPSPIPALGPGGSGGITSIGASIDPKQSPYNAKFDARWTADGATTSGQPTITSATINCTSTDVGKKVYTISNSSAINRIIGTILSCTPTTITASANASATESSSGLAVCTDDTAALVSAWNAAIAANKLLQLPGGAACTSGPLFEATAPAGTFIGYSVLGAGVNNTILVMTPDFNFAGCALGCIYGVSSNSFPFPSSLHFWPQVGEFSVTGLSSLFQGGAGGHSLFQSSTGAVYRNIEVNGVCGPNTTPIMILNTEERAYNMNFQGFCTGTGVEGGSTMIDVVGSSVEIYGPILAYSGGARAITFENSGVDGAVFGGLLVATGVTPGSFPHSAIGLIGTNARLYGTQISPPQNANGIDVDPTSTLEIHGAKCTASTTPTTCLNVQAGGVALVQDFITTLSGGGIAVANAGTVFDLGGNRGWGATSTGLAPTCAMTTGGGTGPTCALVAGSTNEKGTIRMTPGTTPGATGTTTMTFAGTFSGAQGTTPDCNFSYANTGTGAWSLTTTTPIIMTTRSSTVPVFNWNQTGALTAASTYDIDYVCGAR